MKRPFGFSPISELQFNDYKLVNTILDIFKEKRPNMYYVIQWFKKDSNGSIELVSECGVWLSLSNL